MMINFMPLKCETIARQNSSLFEAGSLVFYMRQTSYDCGETESCIYQLFCIIVNYCMPIVSLHMVKISHYLLTKSQTHTMKGLWMKLSIMHEILYFLLSLLILDSGGILVFADTCIVIVSLWLTTDLISKTSALYISCVKSRTSHDNFF